jgi:lysozyme
MTTPLNLARAEQQLVRHEGIRLVPYKDSVGKLTVLVGYNLDERGLRPLCEALGRTVTMAQAMRGEFTEADAMTVLRADIRTVETQIRTRFPLYDALNEPRKRALVDFVFNLGIGKASTFTLAIDALTHAVQSGPPRVAQAFYHEAAWHAMDSLWARQVDDGLAGKYGRADRVCGMLITGLDYTK